MGNLPKVLTLLQAVAEEKNRNGKNLLRFSGDVKYH
jgi:hypothetical protein